MMLISRCSAVPIRSHVIRILAMLSLVLCLWSGWAQPAQAEDHNKAFLAGADFSGQDITDSSFSHANMRESNLENVNAQGVSFFASNLERANFRNADLRGATLDSTRLTGADLTNANLEGAFAFNIIIDGIKIDGADFTEVLLRDDAQKNLCKVAKGTNPVTGRDTRETLFCD